MPSTSTTYLPKPRLPSKEWAGSVLGFSTLELNGNQLAVEWVRAHRAEDDTWVSTHWRMYRNGAFIGTASESPNNARLVLEDLALGLESDREWTPNA